MWRICCASMAATNKLHGSLAGVVGAFRSCDQKTATLTVLYFQRPTTSSMVALAGWRQVKAAWRKACSKR
jgi:hypothetical protein